nr:YlxR family protein [Sporomusa sphaeroides]
MCVGCQTMKSKKELLRVVRTPDGEVILDPTGKKAGRGAYMCPYEQCLTKAFKEKRLEKALKHQIDEAVYNALRAGVTE